MPPTDNPLSLIQAVTACGVLVWDAADEEIIAANETATQALGLPLNMLRGEELRCRVTMLRADGTVLPWEERPTARALRTGQEQRNVLLEVVHPDGRRHTLCVDAVPVRRDDGMVCWVVTSFLDVSEQRVPLTGG